MALPDYYVEARKFDGLKEIIGSKDEERIVQFFADAGHDWVKDDETAWCAAFGNAMLAKTGWVHTGKLNARSFLDLDGAQVLHRNDLREGDIVVLKRGTSAWQGHITFFVKNLPGGKFQGFGGNQKNMVTTSTFDHANVLGYRRPTKRVSERPVVDDGLLYLGMPKNKRVEAMQDQLKELGYRLGNTDGKFGRQTRDAVLAWKADNDLPLDPKVSPRDLQLMESSGPRQVSAERSEATAAEVAKVDRSVAYDASAVKTAVGVGAAVGGPTAAQNSGLLEGLKDAGEKVGEANSVVDQVVGGFGKLGIDVASFVSSHSTLLLIVGLVAVGYFVWKSQQARVADHREGRRLD